MAELQLPFFIRITIRIHVMSTEFCYHTQQPKLVVTRKWQTNENAFFGKKSFIFLWRFFFHWKFYLHFIILWLFLEIENIFSLIGNQTKREKSNLYVFSDLFVCSFTIQTNRVKWFEGNNKKRTLSFLLLELSWITNRKFW